MSVGVYSTVGQIRRGRRTEGEKDEGGREREREREIGNLLD